MGLGQETFRSCLLPLQVIYPCIIPLGISFLSSLLLLLLSHFSPVPIDGSPPGSSVHAIFQARGLEWGAIAFSTPLLFLGLENNTPGKILRQDSMAEIIN